MVNRNMSMDTRIALSFEISKVLQKIKQDIINNVDCVSDSELNPAECILLVRNLRGNFADLADAVQINRVKIEKQKQMILRGKVFNEGLRNHIGQIKRIYCQNNSIAIEDVSSHMHKQIKISDWQNASLKEFQQSVKEQIEKRQQLGEFQKKVERIRQRELSISKRMNEIGQEVASNKVRQIQSELTKISSYFQIQHQQDTNDL